MKYIISKEVCGYTVTGYNGAGFYGELRAYSTLDEAVVAIHKLYKKVEKETVPEECPITKSFRQVREEINELLSKA